MTPRSVASVFDSAGGIYVAIDVTAGERQRGSFEPLLVCPVSRGALVGQDLLLAEVMRGEPLGPLAFSIAAAVSLVLSAVCLAATARLFESERIIFGR